MTIVHTIDNAVDILLEVVAVGVGACPGRLCYRVQFAEEVHRLLTVARGRVFQKGQVRVELKELLQPAYLFLSNIWAKRGGSQTVVGCLRVQCI